MNIYTEEECTQALQVITSSINRCIKMQPKFVEGTSQHSLLRNRIKALQIVQTLIEQGDITKYSKEELNYAMAPIRSIQHKCEKAQSKYVEGSTQFKRFQGTIDAMKLSEEYLNKGIEEEIE